MLAIVLPQPGKCFMVTIERHCQPWSAYPPRRAGHRLVVETVLDYQPPERVFADVVIVPEQINSALDCDRLCPRDV
ncbi:hypothetical protein [Mesorhizobium ventifaucium]|uniref:hypothetical protein n=1 Tax=Mesorhizobium ventifaucium TaxID=666020 RepID=UPI0020A74C8F|nr:hypothetical protein [Mesorhizobium ventifaucium]